MATRQYIGARYVPKFYEGTQGSEWDSGVPYEAFTVVTWLNTSYTSKKNVPASVGAPNLNPEYWVATGMYNEQLAELVEEVNALTQTIGDADSGLIKEVNDVSADVTDLTNTVGDADDGLVKDVNDLSTEVGGIAVTVGDENSGLVKDVNDLKQEVGNGASWLSGKEIFVFGDSLAVAKEGGIFEHVKELVPDCNVHNYAVNGTDYSQIATAIGNTDISTADVIYILGGTNNWQGDTSLDQFYGFVTTAISNILTQKPTVKIVLICPPYSWSSNFVNTIAPNLKNNCQANTADYGNIIKFVAKQNNIDVIDLHQDSGIGKDTYTHLMENSGSGGSTIYVHPISKCNEHIASLIVNQSYNSRYIPFSGKLVPYYDTSGIAISQGEEVNFDPNNGALCMSSAVWFATGFSAPSGYHLQLQLPYGSWVIMNQLRPAEYRFPILDYSSMSIKSGMLTFNATQYMGAFMIEGTPTGNTSYVISH